MTIAPPVEKPEPEQTFAFEHWSAVAARRPDDEESFPALRVTDVVVSPESSYVFSVTAGHRQIVSFLFRDLPHATQAADAMRSLLPRIETVLRFGLSAVTRAKWAQGNG